MPSVEKLFGLVPEEMKERKGKKTARLFGRITLHDKYKTKPDIHI